LTRCYTIHERSVYIYATAGDTLIDLHMIPEGIGLFCAEVPWRLSPWVAVSEEAPEEGLRILEMLLRAEGYRRVEADRVALDDYFVRGDERMLPVEAPVIEAESATLHQWTLDDKPSAQARATLRRPSRRRRVSKPTPLPRAS
jgi:hypothetical protein